MLQPVPFEWKRYDVPGQDRPFWMADYEPGPRDKKGRLIGYDLTVHQSAPDARHGFSGHIWQRRDYRLFGRATESVDYDSLEEAQAALLALAAERIRETVEKEGT